MALVLQAASRESLVAVEARLDAYVDRAGAGDLQRLGDELFAVTRLLSSQLTLRRHLADPSVPAATRSGLVQRLLGSQLSPSALDFVAAVAEARWSRSVDLVDALEALARRATLGVAEKGGRLDDVEDELFRFARTVEGNQGLRDAFSQRVAGTERKADLVRTLLEGRAAPETVRLAVQAAAHPRGLRTAHVLEHYVQAAAERRRQVVVHVVAAAPLTREQRRRLEAALQRRYGRVRLNVDVDPEVLGGLRVQVGSDLIDGTLTARLDEARRRLAG